jgi:hypothetical protein
MYSTKQIWLSDPEVKADIYSYYSGARTAGSERLLCWANMKR